MSFHWVFNDCDEALKTDIKAYWEKKWPRLGKLLSPYKPDLQDVRLTVYHRHNDKGTWFEIRAVIHLPTGTLVAEARDKSARPAIDQVVDKLAGEIKRHKELVRHDYVFKRKARQRADLSAAGPMLQHDAETGQGNDFFRLMRPMLSFLRDHARRELRILEIEGVLNRGEVTVTDLLDEVQRRAWERFAERPRKMPLHLWLTDLLHETLEDWVKQVPRPHRSLEEEVSDVRPAEVPQVDEQDWWATLLGYQETSTLGDLVPDSEGGPISDGLDAEEESERVLSLLQKLPRPARQAFLLHAMEDYSLFEIAMLQDRPEGEVAADIEAARQMLRERLSADGHRETAAAVSSEDMPYTE